MFKLASPTAASRPSWARHFSRYAHNDQIFVHATPSKSLQYSFSPRANAVPIGHTTANASLSPHLFQVNPKFVQLLQATIADRIPNDFTFIMEGGVNANTFMPIYDMRETPRYARTPEIENVFGYIQVDANGKMVPGTYQDNVMYRVLSGTGGLPKLSEYLYEQVQAECEAQNANAH
ncbi:uncharacterized protein CANTADRAFT_91008 [Suhomyces tanzawaensis NRRL Y-17324]|uniref:Uncharacterized protein n=1 Tax=Suhomyces tanzawaensis NRRL Y-17324 TaxID=984487 RepID=A0A1E4SGU2_9ASCO|nr:uncharacterized protein CANTADRAFT_91008 [Suhomyces tanzawaensis NRRL Y-17324]ODV78706.1 hypothetical protein CANTADRAFT_91008 [Suhomyces tanzawaensis NRRL Y-17324]